MTGYTVYVTPRAWREIKELPGHVRQRIRRVVSDLAEEPRPAGSKALQVGQLDREFRRVRLDNWRVVYLVTDAEKTVDVVAVRRRPPYDYGDLEALLGEV